jgi:hypothetical protein
MATAMRDLWSDERLDDLNHRVDRGFEQVGREFQTLRMEMQTEFAAVRSELRTEFGAVRSETKTELAAFRSELQAEFRAVRAEAAEMHRTTLQATLGSMAVILVGFAGTIATVLATT